MGFPQSRETLVRPSSASLSPLQESEEDRSHFVRGYCSLSGPIFAHCLEEANRFRRLADDADRLPFATGWLPPLPSVLRIAAGV